MKITTSNEKLNQIKKAGFILKPNSPEIKKDYEVIKNHFLKANIEVILEKQSALMINEGGIELENLCQICDFLVSIGGDGTLISVVRRSFKFDIPVLGVHLGTLGFLTDIRFSEVESFLSLMFEHKYRIDHRMMIKGCANEQSFVAFNDIVITRKSVSSMISLSAKIDGKPFNSYYGDGVIISTPTGSTAYNLSVGGPIVYPLTEAFIVTPVAPHSLTQRPLVLPADFKIEFTITDKQGALVIIDGQDIYEVNEGESIKIEISANKARLIHRCERNYFEVLNEKLRWGN
ncbi:NAD(+)/NADH kinase [Arcobacter sp. F2176]|uniref:NAD(+)/NADH kinase n=1 Tax=unclassified Arcobacter TaxID=2593671 RepID=UPI00100BC2E3|nr:NAD(+)/NADH kinase [Arcobacter sp. F2176]RXJ80344.1 NAD(+) kinase [Arcobacter sp. F2176]